MGTHHWLVMMKTVVLFYFLTIFCCYSVSAYKNQIRPYKSNLEKNRAIQYAFCLMFLFNNLRDRHQKLNNAMICKYGISLDACEALKAMGVNILEKEFQKCVSKQDKITR